MKHRLNYLIVVLFLLATVALSGCNALSRVLPRETVDGPESSTLLSQVRGTILYDGGNDGKIAAYALPEQDVAVVLAYATGEARSGSVHAVSNPDINGRFLYIDDFMGSDNDAENPSWHRLVSLSLQETGTQAQNELELFNRPGNALWDHVIGEHLALSSNGTYVAFVGPWEGVQMEAPPQFLPVGALEIWDVTTQTPLAVELSALDEGLAWLPDGIHLAYIRLVARDELPADAFDGPGIDHGEWARVPAVFLYNMQDGSSKFVAVGSNPVLSPDGKSMIVWDRVRQVSLVTLESGERRTVDLPGLSAKGAIAFAGPESVLYWGYPTTGSKIRYNSTGSQMQTIKVAHLETGEFQTVIDVMDPFSSVAFGDIR